MEIVGCAVQATRDGNGSERDTRCADRSVRFEAGTRPKPNPPWRVQRLQGVQGKHATHPRRKERAKKEREGEVVRDLPHSILPSSTGERRPSDLPRKVRIRPRIPLPKMRPFRDHWNQKDRPWVRSMHGLVRTLPSLFPPPDPSVRPDTLPSPLPSTRDVPSLSNPTHEPHSNPRGGTRGGTDPKARTPGFITGTLRAQIDTLANAPTRGTARASSTREGGIHFQIQHQTDVTPSRGPKNKEPSPGGPKGQDKNKIRDRARDEPATRPGRPRLERERKQRGEIRRVRPKEGHPTRVLGRNPPTDPREPGQPPVRTEHGADPTPANAAEQEAKRQHQARRRTTR